MANKRDTRLSELKDGKKIVGISKSEIEIRKNYEFFRKQNPSSLGKGYYYTIQKSKQVPK